ncbi:RPB1 [Acanthosepion pharaonis]|uniref:RPB1 n=1 Tax=Acanthosepion pharaonis TaxID=158019 RepID=A0A812EGF2_ACAPH|nr:RPB1 [Sepia pharaonis]
MSYFFLLHTHLFPLILSLAFLSPYFSFFTPTYSPPHHFSSFLISLLFPSSHPLIHPSFLSLAFLSPTFLLHTHLFTPLILFSSFLISYFSSSHPLISTILSLAFLSPYFSFFTPLIPHHPFSSFSPIILSLAFLLHTHLFTPHPLPSQAFLSPTFLLPPTIHPLILSLAFLSPTFPSSHPYSPLILSLAFLFLLFLLHPTSPPHHFSSFLISYFSFTPTYSPSSHSLFSAFPPTYLLFL